MRGGRDHEPDEGSNGVGRGARPAVQHPPTHRPLGQSPPDRRPHLPRPASARGKDPRTAQFAAPSRFPTDPVAVVFTGEAAITEVLDLGLRVGEVLLSSGAATADVMTDVHAVTSALGVARCQVDITYTAIAISAHRGVSSPAVNTMRVVNSRSLDYTRLAEVIRWYATLKPAH